MMSKLFPNYWLSAGFLGFKLLELTTDTILGWRSHLIHFPPLHWPWPEFHHIPHPSLCFPLANPFAWRIPHRAVVGCLFPQHELLDSCNLEPGEGGRSRREAEMFLHKPLATEPSNLSKALSYLSQLREGLGIMLQAGLGEICIVHITAGILCFLNNSQQEIPGTNLSTFFSFIKYLGKKKKEGQESETKPSRTKKAISTSNHKYVKFWASFVILFFPLKDLWPHVRCFCDIRWCCHGNHFIVKNKRILKGSLVAWDTECRG